MAEFLSQYIPTWLAFTLASLVHIGLIINLIAVSALIFIWLERKISGRIQDRLGPTRVGGKFGWLQTLADGMKLITKEDLMPEGADGLLFRVAPYVSFGAAVTAYVAIPFAGGAHPWVAQHINTGVFFVIAVLGLEVFGVILAGYSSASKWSLFGAMREAAQVVSYEVPLGMCAVVPVMLAGSMDLVVIGDQQAGWFTNWYLLNDPATFLLFWVYFTCATASVNRAPFDLAEAESELVAGFHTEYSGLRWSFFFMAEYGSMLTVSLLASILFLGGWHGPIPVTQLLGLQPEYGLAGGAGGGWLANMAGNDVAHFVSQAVGLVNVLAKGFIGVSVMMWVRWTLPRLRIDQVMATCLKYCTPISAVMFLGAAMWQFWLPDRNFFGLTASPPATYRVSEGWPVVAEQSGGAVIPPESADAAGAAEGEVPADDGADRSADASPGVSAESSADLARRAAARPGGAG